ncbi:MAG: Gldg family protein [Alphaproteobacteria bacterium]|nr:Gldg family protein [Alphaproteobacteria bacterium]
MNKKLLSASALVLAVVLFLAVNLAGNTLLRGARLDLTENRLYTLSDGSKNVLASIAEPITLRFFYSEKLSNQLPQLKPYGSRVRELLEEYASRSRGKIRLEIIDPEPFSEAEDRAAQAGIQGVPLDQSSGRLFYFGLQGTGSTDQTAVIPFFQQEREQFLEYELTKLVHSLNDPKKPVLAILGDLPLEYGPGGVMAAMRGQAQPYFIYNQLKERFDVRVLKPDVDRIGEDVGVLMVAHPKSIGAQTRYAIDQFVLRGGRAIVFVDPHNETLAQQPGPMGMPNIGEPQASNLKELFEAWGVEFDDTKFVADAGMAIRVATGEGQRRQAVDYVAWLSANEEARNQDDVVTGEIGNLNLASAGAFRAREGAGTTLTPLVRSSARAELMPVDKIRFSPRPEVLLAEIKPTGERYILAARLSGPVRTAFPDGPPPPPAKEGEGKDGEGAGQAAAKDEAEKPAPLPAHLAESKGPVNLILVGDSDMLEDRFWVRVQDFFGQRIGTPIASNADFLINGVDNLSGSDDLISLRSRGRSVRPFEVVNELRREAGQQFLAQEQALQRKLEETEKQIAELQSKAKGSGSSALLSAEERAAIEGFREEMVRTRRELRDVQLQLNQGIERLAFATKFVNIGLVPILVMAVAAALAAIRYQRRKRLAVRH